MTDTIGLPEALRGRVAAVEAVIRGIVEARTLTNIRATPVQGITASLESLGLITDPIRQVFDTLFAGQDADHPLVAGVEAAIRGIVEGLVLDQVRTIPFGKVAKLVEQYGLIADPVTHLLRECIDLAAQADDPADAGRSVAAAQRLGCLIGAAEREVARITAAAA